MVDRIDAVNTDGADANERARTAGSTTGASVIAARASYADDLAARRHGPAQRSRRSKKGSSSRSTDKHGRRTPSSTEPRRLPHRTAAGRGRRQARATTRSWWTDARWSERPGRLDGKVALITGAGSGMGRAAAELFAAEGARVVVSDVVERRRTVGRRGPRRGRRRDVRARRRRRVARTARRWSRAAIDTYGALHVLYNNAGIFPADDGGVLDTPEATWRRVMEINLKGVWLGCRPASPRCSRRAAERS